jgi:hypothetical protein
MTAVTIKADMTELDALIPDLKRGMADAHRQVTERGVEIMKDEAPGRVGKGIQKPEIDGDGARFKGLIIASALVEKPARSGEVHLPSGKTREVALKATRFDIAEAVATGTGVHGPRGEVIRPRKSKFLLIGVGNVEAGESYIADGGEKFIVRPRSDGMEPNPYDERTEQRLDGEVEMIASSALAQSGVTE